jgi:hypothetical protein
VSRKPLKSGTVPKRLPGFKVQPRDEHIVWFAGTHGYVTMPHIKLLAFESRNDWGYWESVSEQAVYRRLKRLCDAGLLTHQRTWYGDHGVYRATRAGLKMVGLDLAPARLDKRDYEHDLRVVDLALDLTGYTCDGWITERQIRSRLRLGTSIGRVPDGLLLGPGGERWAVELEISGKETQRYHDACDRYADRHRDRIPDDSPDWYLEEHLDDYIESGGEIDGVVWYFFSDKKRRRALAAAERVIADRNYDRYRTDHLYFRFHGADQPSPPPFEKWEEQEENDLREAERLARERRETAERRKREKRHAEAVAAAERYLTAREQAKAVEDVQNRKYERGGWHLTKEERDEALIDAMLRKREREREKERSRQRTRETIRNLFGS